MNIHIDWFSGYIMVDLAFFWAAMHDEVWPRKAKYVLMIAVFCALWPLTLWPWLYLVISEKRRLDKIRRMR